MRELDGDILELGIDQPGTPVLRPIGDGAVDAAPAPSVLRTAAGLHVQPPVVQEGPGGDQNDHNNPISPNRLPLLPESAAVTLGVGKLSHGGSTGGDDVGLPISSDASSSAEAKSDAELISAPNFSASPMKAYRRCLSGDMETIATVGQSGSNANLVDSAEPLTTPLKRRQDVEGGSNSGHEISAVADDKKQSPNSVANGSSAASPRVNRSIVDDAHDVVEISSPIQLVTARDCRDYPALVVRDRKSVV